MDGRRQRQLFRHRPIRAAHFFRSTWHTNRRQKRPVEPWTLLEEFPAINRRVNQRWINWKSIVDGVPSFGRKFGHDARPMGGHIDTELSRTFRDVIMISSNMMTSWVAPSLRINYGLWKMNFVESMTGHRLESIFALECSKRNCYGRWKWIETLAGPSSGDWGYQDEDSSFAYYHYNPEWSSDLRRRPESLVRGIEKFSEHRGRSGEIGGDRGRSGLGNSFA